MQNELLFNIEIKPYSKQIPNTKSNFEKKSSCLVCLIFFFVRKIKDLC